MNAEEATKRLYKNRKLSLGYPELEKLGASAFTNTQSKETNAPRIVRYIEEAIDLPAGLKGGRQWIGAAAPDDPALGRGRFRAKLPNGYAALRWLNSAIQSSC